MNMNPELQQAIVALSRLQFDRVESLSLIDQVAGFMRHKRVGLDTVLSAYEQYLSHHPDSPNAAFNYAYNLAWEARFDAAIHWYKRSLELRIDTPEEVHLNIANIYMEHLRSHDSARAHLEKALDLNPNYSAAYYNLGNLAEQQGNRDEAGRNFDKSLHIDPSNESALARLADTKKDFCRDSPLLLRLIATAEASRNSDLHFALGRAYEQLGEFDLAWRHYSFGNALDEQQMPAYDPDEAEAFFGHIRSQCDRRWLEQFTRLPGDHPVFICGMFRSGSTLLEQMLASHPSFTAGGESQFFPRLVAREIPDYPEGLSGLSTGRLSAWREAHAQQIKKLHKGSVRLTDKRPDNFLYLGLVKAVLPSAKFLVTERDWRDIAASVYSVRLGPTQTYATRLENIRHYVRLQVDLIDHWAAILGGDLMRVSYEQLVTEPKQVMTELLQWLGDSWDERCLSFHQSTNSVQTASVWQVREPLYTKSVDRWKQYEHHFVATFGDHVTN
jgi:tetratricopeptide (TPR) repeat protein